MQRLVFGLVVACAAMSAPTLSAQTAASAPASGYSTEPWHQGAIVGINLAASQTSYFSSAPVENRKDRRVASYLIAIGAGAVILGVVQNNEGSTPPLLLGGTVIGLVGLILFLRGASRRQ